ncbi:MAG: branched-chain amino acid ABC transporter permease [Rhodobacteraceae bacterium]|nr:branched-chain amino acid ABC transporter permease [Paracoccaceae bacterium]
MIYREAGDFKTSYAADAQAFPIRFDRFAFWTLLAAAFLIVPLVIDGYWSNAILLPFLIWSIAALGLNILTGYCGQVSLGTGGFMAVGAFASFKLMTAYPGLNVLIVVVLAGGITAAVGMVFGLPSLRIKGFYLAVATLAAQFFLVWLFNKVPWFMNYSATGQINAPVRRVFGQAVTGAAATPAAKYLFCLAILVVLAVVAKNLTRGRIGRSWMAIRDMDIAAEIIGVNPLVAKLSAFAVSSFFIGVAGALYFAVYFGAVEVTDAFGIRVSFLVLFMIIIGGLGSILGSFLGAAFMVLLPIGMKNVMVGGLGWPTDLAAHVEFMLLGALIMGFLIVEPHGLAQLWRLAKEKLRLWPFPY